MVRLKNIVLNPDQNAIDIVKLRAMETTFLDTVIYKGDRFNCHRSNSLLTLPTPIPNSLADLSVVERTALLVPTFQTDLLAILSFLPVKRALSNLT